ncbi:hypothetical protein Agub_g12529, partial [Astrephomene gubernaculifera]
MATQKGPPDDDTPLLQGRPEGSSSATSAGVPQSAYEAHRRRLGALMLALWDSGVACVCLAALSFSFAAFFVKLIGPSMPVFQIVAFRSLTSFTACALFARARKMAPLFGRRANLRLLIARGLFGAAAMTTYYFSIKMLPLADAVTLFFLNPAITAVAAWVIMREPLGLRGAAGVLISLCGLVLVTRPPFLFGSETTVSSASDASSGMASSSSSTGSSSSALHADNGVGVSTAAAATEAEQRLFGTLMGLSSALLSAGAFICIRYIGKREPPLVMSVYFHVCAALTSIGPLAAGLPTRAIAPSGAQWLLLWAVSAGSFVGQLMIGRGFQLLHAARASGINFTQVVLSYIQGLLFLHEHLTLLGGAGSLLIAGGAILVNLKSKNPAAAEAATPSAAEAKAASAAAADDDAAGGAAAVGGGGDAAATAGKASTGGAADAASAMGTNPSTGAAAAVGQVLEPDLECGGATRIANGVAEAGSSSG